MVVAYYLLHQNIIIHLSLSVIILSSKLPHLKVTISRYKRLHLSEPDPPIPNNRPRRFIVVELKDGQVVDAEFNLALVLDNLNLVKRTSGVWDRRQRVRALRNKVETRRLAQVRQMERPLLGPAPSEVGRVQRAYVGRVVLRVTPVPRLEGRVKDGPLAVVGDGGGAEEEHGQTWLIARGEFPGDADAVGEDLGHPVDEVVVWVAAA